MENTELLKPKINNKLVISIVSIISFFALFSIVLMYIMKTQNYFSSGNDMWGHLFKSDLMYKSIKSGDYYPLYTELWYNGIQPYRYWAPLPYYIMAGLQYLAGGSIINAYYLFTGLSFFVGAIGWLLWGISSRRIVICSFLGTIWFFMPENFRIFFCEGNLPRMVIAILLPYIVYFLWRFVEVEKNTSLFAIILLLCMSTLCHVMVAAMIGISSFIFLAIYSIYTKKVLRPIYALTGMLLSFALCGIWLYPALIGGIVGMDSTANAEVMGLLSAPLSMSLNPMNRISGVVDTFYYGISVTVVSLIGILLSNKKEKAGFYTVIIILLATTTAAMPFLSKLPLSQILWMRRFAPIAYALFFCSLIEWKKCKRKFMLILALIIVIDCIPSFNFSRYYTQLSTKTDNEIEIAETITNQRVALMDLSSNGSYPSWELCEGDNPTNYTFGWAWQGASTASNIVMLNTALEQGYFNYMFDRCIELGNDTVIVKKELLQMSNKSLQELCDAASNSQYNLYCETKQTYVFHRDVSNSFGVITKYEGLAIGKSASNITLCFPKFTVGNSDNIEDYTFEELSKYKIIYLSDFKYNSRKTAEAIVQKLSAEGIKIVIDMNRIPTDKITNRKTFLGVTAQNISFEKQYPNLIYRGNSVMHNNFNKDYTTWNTVYLDNIKYPTGKFYYLEQDLDFIGTNDDRNIVFVGLNILFHAMQTDDKAILSIMSETLNMEENSLPTRQLVNIDLTYKKDLIIIDTPVEGVNTTIAFQDNFVLNDSIKKENNLLIVTEKHTEIKLIYPYLKQGIIVTVIGILGILALYLIIIRKNKEVISNKSSN
ncbi:6-pyruvoyl tetrahydrobiopterin synthase [Ruminiclostridium herbifermentans]|uniref:6-pyruvoyl tetrahydrobiopterin synthase n=1 Tax=Ruminiclostridium herbifermentans TaxID=2488810 RepID=A0A4U7J6H8_9FIRM|nr:6-pyruvoyl-tetrahydropterin synthase-related protein [Ruminiclostridium herbifermentans]QNU66964.1 6-pyruvoyl tetrahydrobiopterin synthase [Ruminiclostridium herbifermentans]